MPKIWNLAMHLLMSETREECLRQGVCLQEDRDFNESAWVWADNVFLYVTSLEHAQAIVTIMTRVSGSLKLTWGGSSLKVSSSEFVPDGFHIEAGGVKLKKVNTLEILGELFDAAGTTETSAEHRATVAQRLFAVRRNILTSRSVRLEERASFYLSLIHI